MPPPPLNDHNLLRWPETFCQIPLNLYETRKMIQNTEQSETPLNTAPSSFNARDYVNARGTYLNKYGKLTTKAAILLSRGSVSSSISSKPNLILT